MTPINQDDGFVPDQERFLPNGTASPTVDTDTVCIVA